MDAHKISYKAKFSIINENEIFTLKNKLNALRNILKKCKFDRTRLVMFLKRQKKSLTHYVSPSHNHTHTQAHAHYTTNAHAHHAHTHHAFLYSKLYTCTYCGRQGHLAKFCYDKLNALIVMFEFEKLTF